MYRSACQRLLRNLTQSVTNDETNKERRMKIMQVDSTGWASGDRSGRGVGTHAL